MGSETVVVDDHSPALPCAASAFTGMRTSAATATNAAGLNDMESSKTNRLSPPDGYFGTPPRAEGSARTKVAAAELRGRVWPGAHDAGYWAQQRQRPRWDWPARHAARPGRATRSSS